MKTLRFFLFLAISVLILVSLNTAQADWTDWSDYWTFTIETDENNPPNAPSNPSPSDGAINQSLSPTMRAYFSDPDGGTINTKFYGREQGGSFSLIYFDSVSSGSYCSFVWSGRSYETTYEWYATANDSLNQTQSSTWDFTTISEPVVPPNETNVAPTIDFIVVTAITNISAKVSWYTNQTDSDNRVQYGTNQSLIGSTWSSWGNNTLHPQITLSSLTNGTKYYYRVRSYNGTNSSLYNTSLISNFTTLTNAEQEELEEDNDTNQTYFEVEEEAVLAWKSFFHNIPRWKFSIEENATNQTTIKLPTQYTVEYFGLFWEHDVTVASISVYGYKDSTGFIRLPDATKINSSGYWKLPSQISKYDSVLLVPNSGFLDNIIGRVGNWLHKSDALVSTIIAIPTRVIKLWL